MNVPYCPTGSVMLAGVPLWRGSAFPRRGPGVCWRKQAVWIAQRGGRVRSLTEHFIDDDPHFPGAVLQLPDIERVELMW